MTAPQGASTGAVTAARPGLEGLAQKTVWFTHDFKKLYALLPKQTLKHVWNKVLGPVLYHP